MDKETKDKWVAGLRSGKYKQGRGMLKRNAVGGVKHCCLGVLCEISGLPITSAINRKGSDVLTKYVPISKGKLEILMQMNDGFLYDFNEIANHIEQNI